MEQKAQLVFALPVTGATGAGMAQHPIHPLHYVAVSLVANGVNFSPIDADYVFFKSESSFLRLLAG